VSTVGSWSSSHAGDHADYSPHPVTLAALIKVGGLRWTIEDASTGQCSDEATPGLGEGWMESGERFGLSERTGRCTANDAQAFRA
jgi:hypothetical protein